ncbi:MAG: hypothetical protein EB078_11250 [Proteobacteria bacterium]|nr:hypothetical protein [Pseudomonadota bacterium]NDD05474.1 hypothetical protein [Pseudomonadota bacterium]NDG27736.1 hypothetical protein [Pseudomonadota bacterium]
MSAPQLKQVFSPEPPEPEKIAMKYLLYGSLGLVLIILAFSSSFIVDPGHRGILVTLGKVSPEFVPEGFGLKMPLVTNVVQVPVRQQTSEVRADCFSSDLQQCTSERSISHARKVRGRHLPKLFRRCFRQLDSPSSERSTQRSDCASERRRYC